MTQVAVRTGRWHSIDVYHELDDDGEIDCHLSDRDTEFRRVEKVDLPDHVEQCAHCAGRGYAKGNHQQDCWAARLRSADDPEEVLRS